jgi:hypothetical protein
MPAPIHPSGRSFCCSSEDIRRMRVKIDETCEELGLFWEDRSAREAVGRAVLRAFTAGLEGPSASGAEFIVFSGEDDVVKAIVS